ncbi:STAS domain-containing protein [Terrabacter sp. BE26]|uniref:STAS domain-containing protein n=1 Tax=Terrabacter sp. BE26 TaxID=2898152 RepID=UPI0035BEA230
MDAHISRGDGVVTVSLAGEIDTYTASEVRQTFDTLSVRADDEVVVDLGEVTFLDSTGIGAILSLHRRVTAAGGRLQLNCSGITLQLMRLMGIDQVIDVVPIAR